MATETLLDGEAEALTRKCVELAKGGNAVALRLCLERILPARKSRSVALDPPPVDVAADLIPAFAAVVKPMASGEIAPDEAMTVAGSASRISPRIWREPKALASEPAA